MVELSKVAHISSTILITSIRKSIVVPHKVDVTNQINFKKIVILYYVFKIVNMISFGKS